MDCRPQRTQPTGSTRRAAARHTHITQPHTRPDLVCHPHRRFGCRLVGHEHMRNNASPTPPPISSEHWPPYARYLAGYPLIKQNGNGMAKIDNRANPSAVFIELHRGENRTALRTFYIPARADFTLFELDHLPYRLRYRQISTGTWSENTFRLDNASTPMHIVLQRARPDTP